MRQFFVQLGWEFFKLAARPRTWFAFVAAVVFELLISTLLRFPIVRTAIAQDIWKMRWSFDETFSGLTTAGHMLGESAMVIGAFGTALIAGDIVAKESEDGTLRMTLCRPVPRGRLLLQKFIVCAVYSTALSVFLGASALAVGLLFEGRGPLLMVAPHEGVIGAFDYDTGLRRYWLAVALLCFSGFSFMVTAFAFSCFNMRPAAAVVLAVTLLVADTSIRTAPGMAMVQPWCVTTRLLSWRQVFNDEIPWSRIERNYTQLAWWDAAWVAVAWLGFRRRDIKN